MSDCPQASPLFADERGLQSGGLTARVLFESLIHAPILIDDLPESKVFDRSSLTLPDPFPGLNFHQKLGHLCEESLALLLAHHPEYDLLETRLPVRRDRHHTIGELDFLLQKKDDDTLVHLELAAKFYLAVETETGLTLPGPDTRDDYFKKLARLRDHQLVLTSKYRDALPDTYRNRTIVPRHLVLGALFDHIDGTDLAQPEAVHPQARRGRWLTIGELPSHFEATTLRLIPKPLWPVPPDLLEGLDLPAFSPPDFVDRCLMVLAPCGTSLFVTPSGYPNHQGVGMR